MNNQSNNILAAVLVAGITAMGAGFIAKGLYHPHTPAEAAFPIEVADAPAEGGVAAAPAVAEPITDLIASADIAHGEKMVKVCAACHTFNAGEPNKVGPNLAGIVGHAKGTRDGFAYSDAMKAKGGKWTVDELNAFLWKPKSVVPGTKMAFAGIKKAEDRAAVVKFLQTK